MTKRRPATPAPAPLEAYVQHFDALFAKRNQRAACRRYLEGLLLPAERTTTLTALANTEPVVAAQHPRAHALPWLLSESRWDPALINARRLEIVRQDARTAPTPHGVLVIDETGDRKAGTKTAHVGRQYLANLGKIDNGVVSVSSLWADERVYYPLEAEPYTPAHHFARGKADPAFRTKPQIAQELVLRALEAGWPFRAVVADCLYGENEDFHTLLHQRTIGYVLALQRSHVWWHPVDEIGSVEAAALAAGWHGPGQPGAWTAIERQFRDGHTERWWAVEVTVGPYGPAKAMRAIVATTDPAQLPTLTTWYLVTNLPAPERDDVPTSALAAASLAEVVRLYGLRMWVKQSYNQVKGTLGWAEYQVRSDIAIRRHWALVWCAFSFCWWQLGHEAGAGPAWLEEPTAPASAPGLPSTAAGWGEKSRRGEDAATERVLAGSVAEGPGLVGAMAHAGALLARVVHAAPAAGTAGAA